jgi:hypothetical protein
MTKLAKFLGLVALASLVPAPVQAQDCAECNPRFGCLVCDYGPAGDVENCTQCSCDHCCGITPSQDCSLGPMALAFLLAGDGSLISSMAASSVPFVPNSQLRTGEKVVRRACDGAIVGRSFSSDLVEALRSRSHTQTL